MFISVSVGRVMSEVDGFDKSYVVRISEYKVSVERLRQAERLSSQDTKRTSVSTSGFVTNAMRALGAPSAVLLLAVEALLSLGAALGLLELVKLDKPKASFATASSIAASSSWSLPCDEAIPASYVVICCEYASKLQYQ